MPVEGANLIDEDKASNAAGDDALPEPDSLPYLTSTMRTDLIQARRRSPCRDRTVFPGAAWLKPQDQGLRWRENEGLVRSVESTHRLELSRGGHTPTKTTWEATN